MGSANVDLTWYGLIKGKHCNRRPCRWIIGSPIPEDIMDVSRIAIGRTH